MRILVVNAGSSSCKVQLIDPTSGNQGEAAGAVERLGSRDARYRVRCGARRASGAAGERGVQAAFDLIVGQFSTLGLDLATDPPVAIGHRVVHGGLAQSRPARIDDRVLAAIEAAVPLAPLHNPANLAGIRAALRAFPDVPQVAVFDTGFFTDLPGTAATYAIDRAVAEQHGIRRFGFHGSSHEFVSVAGPEFLRVPATDVRQIVLHLGNGASVSAIDKGIPVDTSMGMTPLEGLVMGTRAGDLDSGVLLHLLRTGRFSSDTLQDLLTRRSGLLGMSGSADMRDVLEAADHRDEAAQLALDVMAHRLHKYIGAYTAVLGGLDVLSFTAGVGENSERVRAMAVAGLEHLGITLDPTRNAVASGRTRLISSPDSAVSVLVVPTNEELPIARHTAEVLFDADRQAGPS